MKESLMCANYLAARVKFRKPERTRLADFTDDLLRRGIVLWQAGKRNTSHERFDTSMVAIEVSLRAREAVLMHYEHSDVENLAQFTSHLILLALEEKQ